METSSESYLTVRDHADALARDAHPRAWEKHCNEPLDQLFRAIWLDEFDDETSHCLLLSPDDVKDHKRGIRRRLEQSSIRVILWRTLPKGGYWIPKPVKKAHEGEYLWKEMATLSWRRYPEAWRCEIIEQVVVLGSVFPQWKARHWTGKPKKGGRKPGSGSYAAQDALLAKKMNLSITNGPMKSPHAAAWAVVDQAEGNNSADVSKVKRLMGRYKELYDK